MADAEIKRCGGWLGRRSCRYCVGRRAPAPSPLPMQETEGALGPYLRALRAHRLAVALTIVASLLGSLAWIQLRTPDYKAEAEVLVTPLPEGNETFVGIPFLV